MHNYLLCKQWALSSLLFTLYFSSAHVEIDRLGDESADEMYSVLELHLIDQLEDEFVGTKFLHCYDATKDVFRFDLKAQG